eukprot:959691_1
MKMGSVLIYAWFTMVLIGLNVATDIHKTYSAGNCDLGPVAVGDEIQCPITVQEEDATPVGEGDTLTIYNHLQLIGSSSSFCENARVSIVYFNGDYGDAHEYMKLYEDVSTYSGDLLQECHGNGKERECVDIDCPLNGSDTALRKSYAVGSIVNLTMYVSAGVDGVHHDGRLLCEGKNDTFKIDSVVTFKCIKASLLESLDPCQDVQCPVNFVCDPDTQGCVRDCDVFAIDGYLRACSAEFDANENELSSLDQRVGALESDVQNISSKVATNTVNIETNKVDIATNKATSANNDVEIASNSAAIAGIQANVSTNAEDIKTTANDVSTNGEAIGDLKKTTDGHTAYIIGIKAKVTSNREGIKANLDSIEVIQGNVGDNTANIEGNSENINDNEVVISSNSDAIQEIQGNVATNTGDISALEERLARLEGRVIGLGPQTEDNNAQSVGGVMDFTLFEEYKSEWFALLVIINVMTCFYLVCQRRGPKVYSPVQMYGFEEDNTHDENGNKI